MLTLLAAWRWLAGLPRILLVCILAALLIASGLWFTYRAGQRHERGAEQRHTVAVAIEKETIVQQTVKAETDSTRAVAKFAKRQSDSSHVRWQTQRADVERYLDSLPKPVVDLIRIGDQMERRDAATITAYVALDAAFLNERAIATEMDSLRQVQVAVGIEPPKPHRLRYAIGGAVVALAGVLLLHAVR